GGAEHRGHRRRHGPLPVRPPHVDGGVAAVRVAERPERRLGPFEAPVHPRRERREEPTQQGIGEGAVEPHRRPGSGAAPGNGQPAARRGVGAGGARWRARRGPQLTPVAGARKGTERVLPAGGSGRSVSSMTGGPPGRRSATGPARITWLSSEKEEV